jgi:hypothetical protein
MKCFLSHSFRAEDNDVGEWFRRFLEAFSDIKIVEAGDRPCPPDEQIDSLLNECDFLCAIVTSRDGAVPQWVSDEISRALALNKTVIAFVEEGIADLGSIRQRLNYKPFCRAKLGYLSPAYVRYIQELRRQFYERVGQSRSALLDRMRQLAQENAKLKLEIEYLTAAQNREDDL